MTHLALSFGEYQFIFLPVALGLLLPTLALPWVLINFQGVSSLTPTDLLWGSYELGSNSTEYRDFAAASREHPELVYLDLVTSYNAQGLYAIWMVTYLASMIAIILSLTLRKWRSIIAVIAGILAISAVIAWFYSMEVLKSTFVEQAGMTGGVIGEEFKGNERALIDSILGIGFGPYLVIPAGAMAILFSIVRHYGKSGDNARLHEKDQPS
jgi:hypothetical protein